MVPARSTVQADDATARITRWDFPVGAATGWHRHGCAYFVVMLVDGVLRIDDGSSTTDVPLTAGQAYRRVSGIEHDVMNASDHEIAFIEIEVKNPELL